jgi:hypothetical protein
MNLTHREVPLFQWPRKVALESVQNFKYFHCDFLLKLAKVPNLFIHLNSTEIYFFETLCRVLPIGNQKYLQWNFKSQVLPPPNTKKSGTSQPQFTLPVPVHQPPNQDNRIAGVTSS